MPFRRADIFSPVRPLFPDRRQLWLPPVVLYGLKGPLLPGVLTRTLPRIQRVRLRQLEAILEPSGTLRISTFGPAVFPSTATCYKKPPARLPDPRLRVAADLRSFFPPPAPRHPQAGLPVVKRISQLFGQPWAVIRVHGLAVRRLSRAPGIRLPRSGD